MFGGVKKKPLKIYHLLCFKEQEQTAVSRYGCACRQLSRYWCAHEYISEHQTHTNTISTGSTSSGPGRGGVCVGAGAHAAWTNLCSRGQPRPRLPLDNTTGTPLPTRFHKEPHRRVEDPALPQLHVSSALHGAAPLSCTCPVYPFVPLLLALRALGVSGCGFAPVRLKDHAKRMGAALLQS